MISIVTCLRKREDMSSSDFAAAFRRHGDLAVANADALRIRGYTQLHAIDLFAATGSEPRPAGFDGTVLLEYDYPSVEAMNVGEADASTLAARALLKEDGDLFIARSFSPRWAVQRVPFL